MPRTLRVFQVDAFTTVRGGGNPAVVALDASVLDAGEMQGLASAKHDGDWVFALPSSASDADLDVRFFSPRKELPFVGHATLALHAVLSRFEARPLRRQRGSTGIVEVKSRADGGFSISQAPPALGRLITEDELREVLALLGLGHDQVDARCPPRIAGGASTRLLLGLCSTAALDRIVPRLPELAALSPRLGAQGYFPFVLGNDSSGGVATEARMFCPAIGIDEDPVSGNAHAMLGVYLHELGLLPVVDNAAGFNGTQGRQVGRPGAISVMVELDAAGKPTAACIAGRAVVASTGELRLA
ncbi:MAG: PhzF family phenazine biosynthesis isomerase [Pseudomonadota bacterium]